MIEPNPEIEEREPKDIKGTLNNQRHGGHTRWRLSKKKVDGLNTKNLRLFLIHVSLLL